MEFNSAFVHATLTSFTRIAKTLMRYQLLLIVLLLSITFLPAEEAKGQWVQTSGPYGGNVVSFAESGPSLFAGTHGGGVFISNNHGASWNSTNNNLSSAVVWALAVNGNQIFAGTDKGVNVSTDNGASWKVSGLTAGAIYAFALSGTNIIAGTSGGIYLSIDSGKKWMAAKTGMGTVVVSALAVHGANIYAGTRTAGMFLSSNNGASWKPVNTGLKSLAVFSLTATGANLFAGTGGGVYLSKDSGATWSSVNNGSFTDSTQVYALTTVGTSLFAGTGTDLLSSSNNGTNWTSVNAGLPGGYVSAIIVSASNILAGTRDGVSLSTNGTSWINSNSGLLAHTGWSVLVDGTNVFMGSDYGVFVSTDEGNNWKAANQGLDGATTFASFAKLGTNLFVGTFGSGIFRSTTNGSSWTNVNSGLLVYSMGGIGSNLIAGTYGGGLMRSTDFGLTWNVPSGLTATIGIGIASAGTNLFALTEQGIHRSTDSGATWNLIISSIITNALASTTTPVLLSNGTEIYVGSDKGVFFSSDYGTTWIPSTSGLTGVAIQAMTARGKMIFGGTASSQVFLSTDKGTSWVDASVGATMGYFYSMGTNGTYVFAGTDHGMFRRPLSDFGNMSVRASGAEVSLQVSPNPTHGALTLHGLPPNTVSITVLNILGERVMVLRNPIGTEQSLDLTNLTTGNYFIRIALPHSVVTQMIVKD